MPRVKLYIAVSLDGYIADREGGIEWLSEVASETGEDYGYEAFYASIGSLAMGRKTYEQVLTLGKWPYEKTPAFVFSKQPPEGEHPHVEFVSEAPGAFLARHFEESSKDLWLVGGAGLISSFREEGLIDEYILTIIPVLLGDGIPLFENGQPPASLALKAARAFESGIVQLHYVDGA